MRTEAMQDDTGQYLRIRPGTAGEAVVFDGANVATSEPPAASREPSPENATEFTRLSSFVSGPSSGRGLRRRSRCRWHWSAMPPRS